MEQTKKVILKISSIAKDIENLCNNKPSEKDLSLILANIHFLRDEYCNLLYALGDRERTDNLEKRADLLLRRSRS